MVIQRGELWWTDFGEPLGSRPAKVRPAVVIQADTYNRSRLNTVLVAVVTSNLLRASAPGNVLLEPHESGLDQPSVVNVSQLATVNKTDLLERIHQLGPQSIRLIEAGLRQVLGLRSVPS